MQAILSQADSIASVSQRREQFIVDYDNITYQKYHSVLAPR
jgi:hypothetical protein